MTYPSAFNASNLLDTTNTYIVNANSFYPNVKPQNTVSVNDLIPNKAAIYFDFNSPVITNTAITEIVDPLVGPLQLISFNVIRQTAGVANVYWTTANEISMKVYSIETSIDGRNYTMIASQNARGGSYNNYTRPVGITSNDIIYFRLKMIDIDGHFSYNPVVMLKNDNTTIAFSFMQNPVKDVLTISIPDPSLINTTARIVNMQGMIVKTVLLQNGLQNIGIRNLPSGTYVFQTIKGNRNFMVRN